MKVSELDVLLSEIDEISRSEKGTIETVRKGSSVSIVHRTSMQAPSRKSANPRFEKSHGSNRKLSNRTSKKRFLDEVPVKSDGSRTESRVKNRFKNQTIVELRLDQIEITEAEFEKRFKLATKERQVGHLPPVKLMQIGASQHYEVTEDYSYAIDYFAIRRTADFDILKQAEKAVPHLATITAKAGFQFDRSSIPRLFWFIIAKDDLSNVPPLFHDLLYRFGGVLPEGDVSPYTVFTRSEADHLFKHLMERCGVAAWRIPLAFSAVRVAGGPAWSA